MPWRDAVERNLGNTNRGGDARFLNTYVNAGRLTRGMLYTEPWLGRGTVQRFRFMVNPSEIAISYNVNDTMLDETHEDVLGINGGTIAVDDGFVSIAFSMLIDRTYDVWSGTLPEGALHDIRQLERVLGHPSGTSEERGSAGSFRASLENLVDRVKEEQVHAALSSRGLITRRPATVVFGGDNAFSFHGYVENLSVSLMKFSNDMAVTRAGIQISMSSFGVKPETTGVGGGGGGGVGVDYSAPAIVPDEHGHWGRDSPLVANAPFWGGIPPEDVFFVVPQRGPGTYR